MVEFKGFIRAQAPDPCAGVPTTNDIFDSSSQNI